MTNNELVDFEVMRKTEPLDTLLKHGAYRFHPKHLRKIEELRFTQAISPSDVASFTHVPRLKQIHFNAGVENEGVVEAIGPLVADCWYVRMEPWSSERLDAFRGFTGLTYLSLKTTATRLRGALPQTMQLELTCDGALESADFSAMPGMTQLELRSPDWRTLASVKLPPKLRELTFVGTGETPSSIPLSALEPGAKGVAFRYCEPSFTAATPRWTEVRKLTFGPCARVSREDLASMFPNVETLEIYRPEEQGIEEAIACFRRLERVTLSDVGHFESGTMQSIYRRFHRTEVKATAAGGDFEERHFSDGRWRSVGTR